MGSNLLGTEPGGFNNGQRDAIHVPIVMLQHKIYKKDGDKWVDVSLKPGDWVKFTDKEFTKVEKCSKEEAHGMVDPFLATLDAFQMFCILLVPGITTPVTHQFEINPSIREMEDTQLKWELEDAKKKDPECAECWVIRNRRLIRM